MKEIGVCHNGPEDDEGEDEEMTEVPDEERNDC